MKKKLPVLTAIVLLAAGGVFGYRSYREQQEAGANSQSSLPFTSPAGITAASTITPGDELLQQARTQLERRNSLTARLRHQVAINGRQLFGVGGYWQQGSGEELRMRLELQIANELTGLLQVSNGRFYWTDQHLPMGRTITRLDLRKLRNELSRDASQRDELGPGQATWSDAQPDFSLRSGGLPTLLASLADNFSFQRPQAMRWTPAPPLPGVQSSFPVFAIVGHWKAKSLETIAPGVTALGNFPTRLPQEVLVLFGQTDLFPYRIEFRKLTDSLATPLGGKQVVPFQLSREPMVLLELSEISLDTQIAANQFDFSPGDAEWDDRTAEQLEKLRSTREVRMAARKEGQR